MADPVALIAVRAGSKGLPGKNMLPLGGISLCQRAIAQALRITTRCILTTDIDELLTAPAAAGVTVVPRPDALAQDDSPIDAVIAHACAQTGLRDGTLILLQVTSPLRTDQDIHQALSLMKTGAFDVVMSVTPTESGILKYGLLDQGRFLPVSEPRYCFMNRQDLPRILRPNGAVYVIDIASFLARGSLATDRLGAFEMPQERSIDIDTRADLEYAEAMLCRPSSIGDP